MKITDTMCHFKDVRQVSWHVHDEIRDVILFSDTYSEKGTLKAFIFIHCSHTCSETGYIYACGCNIFRTITDQSVDDAPNDCIKCVHCHLLADHLSDALEPGRSGLQIVQKLKDDAND